MLKQLGENWCTSVGGVIILIMALLRIYHNPTASGDPETLALIAAGATFLKAADSKGDKKDVEAPKP